jgi:hypothetical protein
MNNVTKRTHFLVPLFFVAFAMVLTAAPANSQDGDPIFSINHYLPYFTPQPITVPTSLLLRDQFGESQHSALLLERFATPVDKNHEGIIDPLAHLTWWRLLDGTDSPFRRVVVTNQFGVHELGVFDAEYLLAPALKNSDGGTGPPDGSAGPGDPGLDLLDHYKCYKVEGLPVDKPVDLFDQFQAGPGHAFVPLYLCNPVEKTHLDDGRQFPIIKPKEHLVCYQLAFPPVPGIAVFFQDQFFSAQIPLEFADLLCVPSLKEEVVQVEDRSWGKVKSIYR